MGVTVFCVVIITLVDSVLFSFLNVHSIRSILYKELI